MTILLNSRRLIVWHWKRNGNENRIHRSGYHGAPDGAEPAARGHQLTVWARRAESMQPLLDAGAARRASPAGAGGEVDLVISMVADAPDVEQVMLGEQGVASAGTGRAGGGRHEHHPAGGGARHRRPPARAGDRLPRCAGFRRRGRGGAGTLSIMVGGSVAAFATARPAFACMGKNIVHVGDSGAGQVAKAANQIVTGVGVLTVAEALNFAARSGVDPARVREALLGGFAYSKILENHGQRMLDRNFKPGFKSWMHQKDMNIVMQSAHELGLCLPVSAATAQMYNAMVGSGLGEEDSIAILKLLERLSGGED
jgi:3-hydroxyisobutyrate dehydrogenase-like beta-hydroxyacid dehydrogenase